MVNTVAVVLLGALGSGWDIRTRRIPNALTLGFALAALVVHVTLEGAPGAINTVAGWAAGLALFLPLFILGGMGAGDVKLLAAIGAWLGPVNAVETALAAGVIGGVLALGLALTRSYASQAFANIWTLLLYWRAAGIRPHPTLTLERHDGPRLAYAVPISIGAMVAVWV